MTTEQRETKRSSQVDEEVAERIQTSTSLEGYRHEYSEICSTFRHYSALRFAIITVFFALVAGLVTIGFGESSSGKPPSQFIRVSIKLGGVIGTFIFWVLEERLLGIMGLFERRLSYLEENHLQYRAFSRRPSRTWFGFKTEYVTRILYGVVSIFWLLSLILSE